jgi:hypothetical protein
VPLVLDAINLVRSSFLPATPATGVASIPLEFRHTDYHADSQRVADNSALQPAEEAQRPAESQRVEVEVDSTSGIGSEETGETPVTIQRVTEQSPPTTEAYAERIVATKGKGKNRLFRVRWVGYTSKYDTWEPIENIRNCIAFQEYCKKYPQFSDLDDIVLSTAAAVRISSAMHSHAEGVCAAMSAAPWEGYGYIGYNLHMHTDHTRFNELSLADAIEHTCAAVGSNTTDGQTYRYPSARLGADGAEWTDAAEKEFIRLGETHETMEFISEEEIPEGTKMMFYNPVLTKKLKNGEYVYRG